MIVDIPFVEDGVGLELVPRFAALSGSVRSDGAGVTQGEGAAASAPVEVVKVFFGSLIDLFRAVCSECIDTRTEPSLLLSPL